jgi:hypothetical protein
MTDRYAINLYKKNRWTYLDYIQKKSEIILLH